MNGGYRIWFGKSFNIHVYIVGEIKKVGRISWLMQIRLKKRNEGSRVEIKQRNMQKVETMKKSRRDDL